MIQFQNYQTAKERERKGRKEGKEKQNVGTKEPRPGQELPPHSCPKAQGKALEKTNFLSQEHAPQKKPSNTAGKHGHWQHNFGKQLDTLSNIKNVHNLSPIYFLQEL